MRLHKPTMRFETMDSAKSKLSELINRDNPIRGAEIKPWYDKHGNLGHYIAIDRPGDFDATLVLREDGTVE